METPITPLNEATNPKKNLIYPEAPEEQNNQEIYNVNQFFVDKEVKYPENEIFILTFTCYRILIPILTIIILVGTITPALLIIKLETIGRIAIIIAGVILVLILLIFSYNKIKIAKDKANNTATIKLINFLCFSKKTIKIDLDNIQFYSKKGTTIEINGVETETTRLFIINNNKNLSGIDLDKSNIKSKPAKFLYSFDCISQGKYGYRQLMNNLNDFVGASGDNPLTFNIDGYMKKPNFNKFFINYGYKYMKFSDNYFTFHLINPFNTSSINGLFIFFTVLSNLIFIGLGIFLIASNNKDMAFIIIGSLLFVVPNIILYLIYKCVKAKKENIFRIDIIYTQNFDRIFIGLVKYTKTSYVNIFEFQMNNINSFILERIGIDNFNLKVIFKNNDSQMICNIKKSQEELEGLAFILNEKLINNKSDSNEINTTVDDNSQL